jgi:rhodanese-related sulfurtransferase
MNAFRKLAIAAGTIALAAQFAQAADNAPAAAEGAPQQSLSVPASAVTPAADPAYTYKTLRLNRASFDALLSKPEQLLVLDIRRPDELVKYGGFPAYLSIQTNDVQKSLAYIPQNRLIVTVSNHAHRAGAVGDILSSYGYHVVGAIGVLDYEAEGGVLTNILPPPPRTASAAPSNSAAPAAPAASSPSAK